MDAAPNPNEGVTTSAAIDWYVNPPSRFPNTHKWGPAIALAIIVLVIAVIWGAAHLLSTPPGPKTTQIYTYTITGTGPASAVSYDSASKTINVGKVALPFSVTVKERSGDYFITATEQRLGHITCTVTSRGHAVLTNTVLGADSTDVCSS